MKRPTASSTAIACLMLVLLLASYAAAAGKEKEAAAPSKDKVVRTQGQMDAKIVHVDKWGVYVPNFVFYWDTDLGKQKVAALTATAERLRNKLATIVYATQSELGKDKRPMLVDITPVVEQTSFPGADTKAGGDSAKTVSGYGDGPKVYPLDPSQTATAYDAETVPDDSDEAQETDSSHLALTDRPDTDPIPLVRERPLEPPPSTTAVMASSSQPRAWS